MVISPFENLIKGFIKAIFGRLRSVIIVQLYFWSPCTNVKYTSFHGLGPVARSGHVAQRARGGGVLRARLWPAEPANMERGASSAARGVTAAPGCPLGPATAPTLVRWSGQPAPAVPSCAERVPAGASLRRFEPSPRRAPPPAPRRSRRSPTATRPASGVPRRSGRSYARFA